MGRLEEWSAALAAVLICSAIAARAQTTGVYLPAELQDRGGNSYVAFENGRSCQLVTSNVPAGPYAGLSFRRPVDGGCARGPSMELHILVTPGLAVDARTVDTRTAQHGPQQLAVFDRSLDLPDVDAMPAPGLAVVLPYSPLPWLVPFDAPAVLYGACWWTITTGAANSAWKVDAHDHWAIASSASAVVNGPAVASAGAECGFFRVSEPPRIGNDYWNAELVIRVGEGAASSTFDPATWLAVLMIGPPLPAPLYVDGCAIRIDPSQGCVVPLSRELRTPWRPGMDRLLLWSQVAVFPEPNRLWTSSLWASAPAPWTPGGFDVNSSFVDSVAEPGHQVFPAMVLWRSTP